MADLSFKAVTVLFVTALALLLGGCGQTGALYLPEDARGTEVVTRPAPPADAPSSPESVDSPGTPASPAPEVTAPEPVDPARNEAEARKKNGNTPPK